MLWDTGEEIVRWHIQNFVASAGHDIQTCFICNYRGSTQYILHLHAHKYVWDENYKIPNFLEIDMRFVCKSINFLSQGKI